MQVILLERIYKLGQMGDTVKVKPGYARNYLFPQKKALRATEKNMEYFNSERKQLEANNLKLKKEAEEIAERIEGKNFIAIRQAGDTGQLYGSVTTRDIAEVITEGGFTIERRQVMLDRPIKLLGLHEIKLMLHPEVSTSVVINVARTVEEAQRQERGEDVSVQSDDNEVVQPDLEEVFEEEALAPADEALSASDDDEMSDSLIDNSAELNDSESDIKVQDE